MTGQKELNTDFINLGMELKLARKKGIMQVIETEIDCVELTRRH